MEWDECSTFAFLIYRSSNAIYIYIGLQITIPSRCCQQQIQALISVLSLPSTDFGAQFVRYKEDIPTN